MEVGGTGERNRLWKRFMVNGVGVGRGVVGTDDVYIVWMSCLVNGEGVWVEWRVLAS